MAHLPEGRPVEWGSPADSTPLKIWSWVRYEVGTGQEENRRRYWGDAGSLPDKVEGSKAEMELLVLFHLLPHWFFTWFWAPLQPWAPGLHIVSRFG